jgi:hypothetical protein
MAARPAGHAHLDGAGGRPPACALSAVSGLLDLGSVGGSSTSPAGAMVLHDTSNASCTLEGVPEVSVEDAGGSAIALYELRSVPRHDAAVVLTPGTSGRSAEASITWSSWTCAPGSYSVEVRFDGWAHRLTLTSSGAPATAGSTCTGTDKTVYVGAVTTVHR